MSNSFVMIRTKNKTPLKNIVLIVLFLSILQGLRRGWSGMFSTPEHPGVLDMRGWDLDKSSSIPLDGRVQKRWRCKFTAFS